MRIKQKYCSPIFTLNYLNSGDILIASSSILTGYDYGVKYGWDENEEEGEE